MTIAAEHKGLPWGELKKLGYRRCSATFINGKQCRREQSRDGWCAKHAPFFDRVRDFNNAAIEAERKHNQK
jgi:hypothetical protein